MQIGCGLFGLAFELEKDMWGTLERLGKEGFTAIEPLYAFKNDPALAEDSPIPSFLKTILWDENKVLEYTPKLKELGLEISSMHVGFAFGIDLETGLKELIEFSKKSGIKHFFTSLEFDTEEKMNHAVELMNTADKILAESDVTLGYHNHYMEFQAYKDGTLMDYFMEKTSEGVKLQLDTGWQMYAGSEILPFIEKYQDRIMSIHLKDFVKGYENIPKDDAFAAIGDGVLPTKEILSELPKLNLIEHGLMIDQDKESKGSILSDDLAKGAEYLLTL